MDIATLAASVTSILVPALPDLVKAGGKESEVIGEKLGTGVWEAAGDIWQRLGSHPLIEPVARDIAAAYRGPKTPGACWPTASIPSPRNIVLTS